MRGAVPELVCGAVGDGGAVLSYLEGGTSAWILDVKRRALTVRHAHARVEGRRQTGVTTAWGRGGGRGGHGEFRAQIKKKRD